MAVTFSKASKAKAKARIAIYGPAGSGKTYTALSLSVGLAPEGTRIAVIDTEHGAASKYADRFDFDTLNLDDPRVESYIEAINAAEDAGYGVIVLDSVTHGWQRLLEEVDKSSRASSSHNTWAAWRDHTPRQKRFVEAIIRSRCHIVATMRTATEWVQTQDGRGKNKPERIGLKPEQGKGIEYEFDLLLQINAEHIATVEKDRSGKFQDNIIEKPGVEFGKAIARWLSDGVDAPEPARESVAEPTAPMPKPAILGAIVGEMERLTGLGRKDDGFAERCGDVAKSFGVEGKVSDLPMDGLSDLLRRMRETA